MTESSLRKNIHQENDEHDIDDCCNKTVTKEKK